MKEWPKLIDHIDGLRLWYANATKLDVLQSICVTVFIIALMTIPYWGKYL